ncbi:ExeA family protein [Photobacterium lutimaris]|uniref:General secretion pathway protein GspA n=1 Tax=Photobacterium lutimaris TaxID=388278 RepID=A0A2T3J2S2_9GAMM|nr:AAA family ATPase [Photobacterium lutimaris]PSU35591.1 general secretion pathway protein GspA [Photobacterium lutimaris]TDR78644.1 type II secretory pathway predicted ATPase ExeA [Photobacterium lutimaris]
MYESFFGLNDKPFKLTPDTRFFYASSHHKKAMSYLHYGFERGDGFIVVTGPSGAGKSLVARNLISAIDEDTTAVIQISTAALASYDLLELIALNYGLPVQGLNKPEILRRLENYFSELHCKNIRSLIIIDEAHHLTPERLEELRMLSNYQVDNTALVQFILFGHDELETMIRLPKMEQFRQRIIASCKLKPFNINEIKEYIVCRLTVAGWRGTPVLDGAIYSMIKQQTAGIPRRINLLMERVLLYSFLSEIQCINKRVINDVILDMRNELSSSIIADDNSSTTSNEFVDSTRSVNTSDTSDTSDSSHSEDNQPEQSIELVFDSLSTKQSDVDADVEKVLKTLDLVSDVLDKVIVRKLATIQHFEKMITKKRREAANVIRGKQLDENILNDADVK